MVSKKLLRLVSELESLKRESQSLATEKKMMDLSFKIACRIPKRVLKKALEHPREIRNRIHPQDTNRHPMLL